VWYSSDEENQVFIISIHFGEEIAAKVIIIIHSILFLVQQLFAVALFQK
jgi:hypothetical protein